MNFLKQLFCKHQWQNNYRMTITKKKGKTIGLPTNKRICQKCGKVEIKKMPKVNDPIKMAKVNQ